MTSIAVYGLGYVGLPTAALFANDGHSVHGVDTDPDHLERLRSEGPDFNEPELNDYIDRVLESGALTVGQDPVEADFHFVCVPTPYDHERETADLSHVLAAAASVGSQLRSGETVVVESTVPPGTTEGPVLETLKRESGPGAVEFELAFCPETVLPGSILEELRHNDRIVGGVGDDATESVYDLFERAVAGDVFRADSATMAEFVKLSQNTFRDVNIALANELGKVARDYDIPTRPAFELANVHPRVSLLRPGPGVGGHCLPVDPLYLGEGSDNVELIEQARAVNDGMVEYVKGMLSDGLDTLQGSRVAVFGLAYKGNVADIRNSPSEALVDTLVDPPRMLATDGGARAPDVHVHDPHVDEAPIGLHSQTDALDGADALVLMTGHDEFADLSPERVAEQMRGDLVVDAKELTDESWSDAGLRVERL